MSGLTGSAGLLRPVVLISLFLVSCGVCLAGGTWYRHVYREMSDATVKQLIRWGHAAPDSLARRDMVEKWIHVARDRREATRARVYAVERLSEYRQLRVNSLFVSLLGDGSMAVREAAARGLGRLGLLSSVRVLIDALRYCRGDARRAVRRSLLDITGNDFGNDIGAWKVWFRQHRREYR